MAGLKLAAAFLAAAIVVCAGPAAHAAGSRAFTVEQGPHR